MSVPNDAATNGTAVSAALLDRTIEPLFLIEGAIDGDRALNRSTVWKTIPRSTTNDVDSPLNR